MIYNPFSMSALIRCGFCYMELEHVPAGIYNVIPTTFLPNQEGPFFLDFFSATPLRVSQLQWRLSSQYYKLLHHRRLKSSLRSISYWYRHAFCLSVLVSCFNVKVYSQNRSQTVYLALSGRPGAHRHCTMLGMSY